MSKTNQSSAYKAKDGGANTTVKEGINWLPEIQTQAGGENSIIILKTQDHHNFGEQSKFSNFLNFTMQKSLMKSPKASPKKLTK